MIKAEHHQKLTHFLRKKKLITRFDVASFTLSKKITRTNIFVSGRMRKQKKPNKSKKENIEPFSSTMNQTCVKQTYE